ncbi:MAG: hypothetical protein VYD64_04260 [Pseudomonadota bacterium]|nr:hypothetical protein [Pseudomonadota bacterium]
MLKRKDLPRIASIAFALLALPCAGKAADIVQGGDRQMGCVLTLAGVIEKGDAAKLDMALEEAKRETGDSFRDQRRRLCLDSPGGSFIEAVEIAKTIYSQLGTAIGRGRICESACSIVFMAGSISPEDDRGIVADRVLHPLGKLGFHAPSLTVPDGQYREGAVNRAYRIALGGIGQLLGIAGYVKLPPTLIGAMLETPPEEMMYIDTVGKASRWMISVAPAVTPDRLDGPAVINACNNWYQVYTDVISVNGFFDARKSYLGGFAEPVIEVQEEQQVATLEGFGQEGGYACKVTVFSQKFGKSDAGTEPVGWVQIGDEVGLEIHPSYLFARDTPLATLARKEDTVAEAVDRRDRDGGYVSKSFGECFVFQGADMLDHEKCVIRSQLRHAPGPQFEKITNFVWPSGGKTVVVTRGTGIQGDFGDDWINGVKSDVKFENKAVEAQLCKSASIPADRLCDFRCWPNGETGNDFCVLDYATYDTDVTLWRPSGER